MPPQVPFGVPGKCIGQDTAILTKCRCKDTCVPFPTHLWKYSIDVAWLVAKITSAGRVFLPLDLQQKEKIAHD